MCLHCYLTKDYCTVHTNTFVFTLPLEQGSTYSEVILHVALVYKGIFSKFKVKIVHTQKQEITLHNNRQIELTDRTIE